MNDHHLYRNSILAFGMTALLALTAATAQIAVASGIDGSGSYRQEVNACLDGSTPQDKDTCLTEARNAQAEKQRGMLESSPNTQNNAMARCEVFPVGEDKAACQARMLSMGSTSGSVAGGGVIREVETVVLPPKQNSMQFESKTATPVILVPLPR